MSYSDEDDRTVLVSNLPSAVTSAHLHDLFGLVGSIVELNVLPSMGHAWIEFDSVEGAKAALFLSRTPLGDREIKVEVKANLDHAKMEEERKQREAEEAAATAALTAGPAAPTASSSASSALASALAAARAAAAAAGATPGSIPAASPAAASGTTTVIAPTQSVGALSSSTISAASPASSAATAAPLLTAPATSTATAPLLPSTDAALTASTASTATSTQPLLPTPAATAPLLSMPTATLPATNPQLQALIAANPALALQLGAATTGSIGLPSVTPLLPYATSAGGTSSENFTSRTIYVGNLGPEVTDEFLRSFFAPLGKVIATRWQENATGPSRYAFVQYETQKSATTALTWNGRQIGDRFIKVGKASSPIDKTAVTSSSTSSQPKPAITDVDQEKVRAAMEKVQRAKEAIARKLADPMAPVAATVPAGIAAADGNGEIQEERKNGETSASSPSRRPSSRSRSRSRSPSHSHSRSHRHRSRTRSGSRSPPDWAEKQRMRREREREMERGRDRDRDHDRDRDRYRGRRSPSREGPFADRWRRASSRSRSPSPRRSFSRSPPRRYRRHSRSRSRTRSRSRDRGARFHDHDRRGYRDNHRGPFQHQRRHKPKPKKPPTLPDGTPLQFDGFQWRPVTTTATNVAGVPSLSKLTNGTVAPTATK